MSEAAPALERPTEARTHAVSRAVGRAASFVVAFAVYPFGGHEAGETRHFLAQLGFLAGLAR